MSNRIQGERVFCYQCEHEWDRAHGGLQCPRCNSEFVEIVPPGGRTDADDPSETLSEPPTSPRHEGLRSLRAHYPWRHAPERDPTWNDAPDPDEGDIHTIHFGTAGGGNSGFSFTRTYTTGFGPRRQNFNSGSNDPVADAVMQDFERMVHGILGGNNNRVANFGGSINVNGRTTTFGGGSHDANFPSMIDPSPFSMFGGPRAARGPGSPTGMPSSIFELIPMLLNPANARSGDAVFSQEALDRVMSQLMEQNTQNGPPPAPQELINQLPKKKIDETMLGNDGRAECSICMDNVELGTEVTVLPCQHWFHFECIESWLKEHDTCPHCRKPITPDDQRNPTQPRPQPERQSSRRSNSMTDAVQQMRQRTRDDRDHERPSSERRSSRRSNNEQNDGGGGGVASWIRSHNPFS